MSLFRSLMMAYVALASSEPIDLSLQDVYGNPIKRSTANCYVVSKADTYKIPLVFGNALKNGSTNSAAYTNNGGSYSHDFVDYNGTVVTSPYIEAVSGTASSAQLSIADTDGIFMDISIVDGSPCRYLQFKVNSIPATGANGVLSIKDSSGVIMWSWHIWVWADSLETVEITNSTGVKYNIMPVNLASKYDSDGVHIKNWFYQWGRPMPLLCPSAYNLASNHASYGALSYAAESIASNIQTGIKNPVTFYKYSTSYNYNWFQTNSGKTYNLWDAACTSTGNSDNNVVKTIYDPCPIGFKMPNGNSFTGLSIISNANGIVKFTRYSGDSTGVGFPMSGCRDCSDGSLYGVGSDGYVWLSSAYSQDYACGLFFSSGYVNPQSLSSRAHGFSVRPVQDGSTTPSKSISTNLNNQWQASSVLNPDSSLYDIYESYSNYNVDSGTATMTITISGMTEFTCYIRSDAESNYDYVMISQLDLTITGSTSYSNTTLAKAHTRGNQQSGTALSNYTEVTYSGIDGGEHTITVVYRKDGSVNKGTDKGYILIPKSNEDLNNKDLITFTINHVKEGFITGPGIYQAERGMTFDEWFFSSYNKIETYVEDTCNLSYSTVGDDYPKFRIDGNGTWWEWRFTNYTGNTVLEDGKDYEFTLY